MSEIEKEYSKILDLLEAFVVENKDLERLETLLAEFNIFEALGAVRQELRHSDYLAFILDPTQNHGLGDAFLKHLLKHVLARVIDPPLNAVEIDVADMRSAVVRREWRHIDILIHDPANRLVCAMENKIDSGERSGQLHRYRECVVSEFPDHRAVFLFLTPEGDQPSDDAYISVSYGEIAWLIDAVQQTYASTLGADVRTLMRHYTSMLRRHIVSESEIAKLCRQIYRRHKQALDLIFEYRPDLQWNLAELLKRLIEEAESIELTLDSFTKSTIRFCPTEWDAIPALRVGRGWTSSGRILLFEIQNTPKRLSLKLIIGPGPDAVRETIFAAALAHPHPFRRGRKRLYPKWTTIYNRTLLTTRDYEDTDPDGLVKKVETEWKKFVSQDLPAIRKVISEIEWPRIPLHDETTKL